MSWQRDSTVLATLVLPYCVQGEIFTITLSFTPADDLSNAFLHTSSGFVGILQGKLSTDLSYSDVGVFSLSPSCYLGSMVADTEYSIDLAITFTTDFIGENIVPVYVGFGDDVTYFEELTWNGLTEGENSWNSDANDTLFGW